MMLSKEITALLDDDRRHAAENQIKTFVRAAETPELALFKEMCGAPGGFGPRALFLVIGERGRIFVSWPRDIALPRYTAQDLQVLLDEASARGVASVVIDPNRRN
jgi:hypothetical protein